MSPHLLGCQPEHVVSICPPLPSRALEAARRLGISLNRLNEIVLGKRGITTDTALRLSRLLKTSPQLWMRLQADWLRRRRLRVRFGVGCVVEDG